ncbi:hypothetical protein CCM_03559 [Cordyceps militaris CM01]|uniref:Uncharacterized protein n=1 Tax=Cordyceps militaris (strain CM01) TaxID=983644 RepID=G3JBC9_CORMM|nr:uncharacterized protein CCM_03559 [Cordyceps militaris CM01]EGX95287.1 hypothetical protein CCM_03559 [Cordyceps militaris CM01]
MVASTPEYHILGKPTAVNRLRLGTIISSIRDLTRLNAGKEPTIDPERLDSWHESDFKATRNDALKVKAVFEFKLAALKGLGYKTLVSSARGNVDQYSFSAVDTIEFEPVPKDYSNAGQAEAVQTFLKKSNYRPIFYITGIKIGRAATDESCGPTFEATRAKNLGGVLVNAPSVPSIGLQESKAHDDRIFAIRVRKLQYKKPGFFRPREWMDEPEKHGAESVGWYREQQKEEQKEPAFVGVEEVNLGENELKGYNMITATNMRGQQVTSVVSEGSKFSM